MPGDQMDCLSWRDAIALWERPTLCSGVLQCALLAKHPVLLGCAKHSRANIACALRVVVEAKGPGTPITPVFSRMFRLHLVRLTILAPAEYSRSTGGKGVYTMSFAVNRPNESTTTSIQQSHADTERLLTDIWRKALRHADFGAHDHFLDIGGDSLSAMLCINLVRATFGVELALEDFFLDEVSVTSLATQIVAKAGT